MDTEVIHDCKLPQEASKLCGSFQLNYVELSLFFTNFNSVQQLIIFALLLVEAQQWTSAKLFSGFGFMS